MRSNLRNRVQGQQNCRSTGRELLSTSSHEYVCAYEERNLVVGGRFGVPLIALVLRHTNVDENQVFRR